MAQLQFKNKWVLVTGASSGLGYETAMQLAVVHQANLILVARRSDKLEILKQEIEAKSQVQVKIVTADLWATKIRLAWCTTASCIAVS